MKKLLTLVSVVAVVGAVNVSSAMDRTGKLGLGAQESFTAGMGSGTAGSWSIKYGVAHNVTGQFVFGFNWGNKGSNKNVEFGAGLLYDLVESENSDFYTGLRFGWNQDKGAKALLLHIPLGFEFSLAGLPEVGFSFEGGLVYNYAKDAGKVSTLNSSNSDTLGGSLGLGVHYYF